MKAKIIFLRLLAVVGMLGVVGVELYSYMESGTLEHIPKAAILFFSFLFLLAGTFIGSLDSGKKVNLKTEFEKEAQCFGTEKKARSFFYRGFRSWKFKHYTAANYYLSKAADTAENPRAQARAYFYLGCCAAEEKKFGRAVESLEQAVQLDRGNDVAWNSLAAVYLTTGKQGKAQDTCETGLLYCPQSYLLHTKLGRCYMMVREREKACKEFSVAERIRPSDPVAVMNMAAGYALVGDRQNAEAKLLQAGNLGYPDRDSAAQSIESLLNENGGSPLATETGQPERTVKYGQ